MDLLVGLMFWIQNKPVCFMASLQMSTAKVSVPSKVSFPVPSGQLIAGGERSAKAERPGVMSPTQQ